MKMSSLVAAAVIVAPGAWYGCTSGHQFADGVGGAGGDSEMTGGSPSDDAPNGASSTDLGGMPQGDGGAGAVPAGPTAGEASSPPLSTMDPCNNDESCAGAAGAAGATGASGSGGSAAGSAGTTSGGAGGTNGGSSAGGGAAGTAAQGGSGNLTMAVTGVPNSFGEALMSSFILLPCYKQDAQDCWTTPGASACPNQSGPFEQQGFTQTEAFKLGGTAGAMYAMTFNLNGISEGKYYQGGTRDAGDAAVVNADSDAGTDTFYRGGAPIAFEHYNVYKMTVKMPDGSELAHYYLNSFPPNVGRYENHNTFALHYTKTIPIPGGGSVELFIGDSNCHAMDNCGPGEYAGICTKSRNIPSEPTLVVPTTYMGTNVADINLVTGAQQPYHAQLIHITVTSVTAM
jgi:hypothetical protein